MTITSGKRLALLIYLNLNLRIYVAIIITCAIFSVWYGWHSSQSTNAIPNVKVNRANTQWQLTDNFVKDNINSKRPLTILDGREAALQLMDVHRKLEEAFFKQTPPSYIDVVTLKRIVTKLNPLIKLTENKSLNRESQKFPENSKENQLTDKVIASGIPMVCPEVYEGFESGFLWRTLNCTVTTPIRELLTIVVNACDFTEEPAEVVEQLLLDFNTSYPKVRVIVACLEESQNVIQLAKSLNREGTEPQVTLLKPVNQSAGKSDWSAAFGHVKTPLTLVARDMRNYHMLDSPLDRLVRVLTETPGVGAVGGSTRNVSSHWKVGCFQAKLQNYVLRYRKGYHHSQSECMFCDYVDGPFLGYSRLLRETEVSSMAAVAFQEFFLKLSASHLAMACPDVMFSTDSAMAGGGAVLRRDTWLPLAAKLELNRVLIEYERSHVLHRFTCREAGINCLKKMDETYSYTLPVCCREELAQGLQFWQEFCRRNGLLYKFVAGTLLGAVKMADMLPWDFNANANYVNANFTFLESSASMFNDNGFPLNDFNNPACCNGTAMKDLATTYMKTWTPNILIFLSGKSNILPDEADTLVEVHGVWVNGSHNPGRQARARFGHKILKHAAHWQDAGMESSMADYEPGSFDACVDPNHHACLDKLPTDGSLAFQVPEW